VLRGLQNEPGTLIFLESPRRVAGALADAAEILGERPVVVARELTKIHEEFLRGSLPEMARVIAERTLRGELTLCIGGASRAISTSVGDHEDAVDLPGLEERFELLLGQGLARNEALKVVVRETGIPRQEAYKALIVGDEDKDEPDQEEKI
jgi:16S rRNA (cytidine1402-2'-O)-methyltransferase